jgi:hypothetical protein
MNTNPKIALAPIAVALMLSAAAFAQTGGTVGKPVINSHSAGAP